MRSYFFAYLVIHLCYMNSARVQLQSKQRKLIKNLVHRIVLLEDATVRKHKLFLKVLSNRTIL